MKVHRKHFSLVGKVPKWITLKEKKSNIQYVSPSFSLEKDKLEDVVKSALDAFFEQRMKKAYVYTATHEDGKTAYLIVTDEECELIGQPLEE